MNPSTAFARVFVDELLRGGVRDAVVCPGSRSAPVALALADAEAAGRLRLHVRIDERTGSFLALGLAKASGRPVPVLTTSGTAAAHLHAAVLEAAHSGVPLLALTADRPPELRSTGANQTVDQVGLYGGAVRFAADLGVPEPGREAVQNRYWRSLTARALLLAVGALSADPGPVHLNLALRDPLMPDADDTAEPGAEPTSPWAGRPDGAPWTSAATEPGPLAAPSLASLASRRRRRTVVVAGDAPTAVGRAAAVIADQRGWPVLAEPSSGAWGATGAVRGAALLLGTPHWIAEHRPDRVLVVGRPTLSRPVGALLADPDVAVETLGPTPRWPDPGRGSAVVGGVRIDLGSVLGGADAAGSTDEAWLPAWSDAAARVGAAVDAVLDAPVDGRPALTAARLARDLVAALPAGALLVLGSSTPVRDVDRLAVPRAGLTVLANRGVAGIDGTISTATGAALAHQAAGGGPAFALMGDLTFLHDMTGLVEGDGEPLPDLTVVVGDNDGGGIFAQLEPGRDAYRDRYRRVFGTPHGRDLVAVARALGWPATAVTTPDQLQQALAAGGRRVVVVRTDQRAEAELATRLRDAAATALS
ncbi:2-succinyl-5-enolpyruvyl-6-hydroxy-3-cyclohexene-1-carboxylic-acid synthase [Modestobacter sp. I12A-02628]|uniref:2-succinyl-5-enolpyruvyl-6-hydroxy-3-cyclohexene-1-carboxylate synthase n=1 Tax=Goekera deserti TaxID=2497753 RepID=A0A7K3W916_9ACTN|nr:2-succinyl-5-enolpyruvyl-6-hydroxy-3-cyclohexene-1-carboxylic-acid synthase [Goekera deserti]MPR00584.1 2-succinyl-5-enolpyruvyl-6-hydroxy-3-cyclohexene-1-carboxylic-acid synthase [Goekera deserti]NDI50565.1 2-succinyl-5-enolpyruvyl-6-hydroxy-3-cyclohexene-1-carboxylic-acid synthase [Goekera deserti]NEL52826.1 2-succinyl-5-enolpyruvyl-6-hydroxy-3-cyclohexene-1-carboxylic-acid synthase [Goekera deserti]